MGPAQASTHTSAHTSAHANTKARINQDEKTCKATGSYLTNLKVNDFSISLYPRLIPVTGIASARVCARAPPCPFHQVFLFCWQKAPGWRLLCFRQLFFRFSACVFGAPSCLRALNKPSISAGGDPARTPPPSVWIRLMMGCHVQGDWEGGTLA